MNPLPLLVALSLAQAAPPPAATADARQPAPSSRRVLKLSEAVDEALKAQPSVRQARAQSQAADARVTEAKAPLLPQVSAGLGYQLSARNCIAGPCLVGIGNDPFNLGNSLTGSVTASQLIWDFGQTTGRWRAAQRSAQAQLDSERSVRFQAAFSVRTAYLNARGSRALVDVADEAVTNFQRHLSQAQGFFEVGTKPKLDVVQAQSDLASAQLQRIQAVNSYRTSKAQLNQAMGHEGPPDFEVGDDTLPPVEGEDQRFAVLLDEAIRARPEIAAAEEQIRAQEEILRSVNGNYWPTLGASSTLGAGGSDFIPQAWGWSWNWNAQVTLSWNIFSGYSTRGQVAETEANIESLKAQEDGLRQQIAFNLEQARLAVEAGKQALSTAEEALALARERLGLAEARYQTGAGSIIELEDAQTAQTNAAGQRVKAEYDLAVARASLVQALGRP